MPSADLAARLYLAYILTEYGIGKFTGGMFDNATPEILATPLGDTDLFHLTWYTFSRLKMLTYFIGCVQVLAAIFLVIPRTVLFGCLLAIPVFLNIFFIDLSCFPDHRLAMRVLFYLLLLTGFIAYRFANVKAAFAILFHRPVHTAYKPKAWCRVLLALLMVGVVILLELCFIWGMSLLFAGI